MQPRYTPQSQPLPWTHADTAHFHNCTAWQRAVARAATAANKPRRLPKRRPSILSFWGFFR